MLAFFQPTRSTGCIITVSHVTVSASVVQKEVMGYMYICKICFCLTFGSPTIACCRLAPLLCRKH